MVPNEDNSNHTLTLCTTSPKRKNQDSALEDRTTKYANYTNDYFEHFVCFVVRFFRVMDCRRRHRNDRTYIAS